MVAKLDAGIAAGIAGGADPAIVAEAILAAVDDPSSPTCVLVGDDAAAAVKAFRQAQIEAWTAGGGL
jgi:hypothetical protein